MSSKEVEDVWAIVHERDGLRVRIRQLEAENRRLHTIIAGYTDQTPLKPADQRTQRRRIKSVSQN